MHTCSVFALNHILYTFAPEFDIDLLLLFMMKKIIVILILAIIAVGATAQTVEKKKSRYDGGMMLHMGYLNGEITPLNYKVGGLTKGIGGAIRFHLSEHFRLGTEGYTSELNLMDNGSYIDTFWAGLMGDFFMVKGKFMPYLGLTVGGGASTSFLMFEGIETDWTAESNSVFNKTGFFALNPYIGCDYIVSDAFHLTLKMDYLQGFSKKDLYLPTGPRLYTGFIFFH